MATIASLIVDVAANTAQLVTGVEKANQKMDALGGVAKRVGGALAGAFTVQAISRYVLDVIRTADAFGRLSEQTGINVVSLQALDNIASDAGNTLDQVTRAVAQMQDRLAGGDKSALAALQRAGLAFSDIRHMSPERQFVEIGRAIASIEDPAKRTNIAMDIFGRAGAEILPTMVSGLDLVGNSAGAMSEKTIANLDVVGDAYERMFRRAKAAVGSFLSAAIESRGAIFLPFGGPIHQVSQALGGLEESVKGVTDAVKSPVLSAPGIGPLGLPTEAEMKQLDADLAALEKQIEDNARAAERAAEEHARFAESVREASFAMSKLGMVVLPELNSRSEEFLDIVRNWKPALDDATLSVEDLQRQGQHMAATIKAMGDEVFMGVLMPALEGSGAAFRETERDSKSFATHLQEFFTNIPAKLGEIQGSLASTLTNLFGASDKSVFGSIISGGLNFIFGPAAGLAADIMRQGMEALGGIVWNGLKKIGGFFKKLFGGPSADELAGREIVESFERNIASMLTEAQRIEAGNDEWKQTVIFLRDKYLELGLTEQDALRDAERLWASSRSGADEAARVVDELRRRIERGITVPIGFSVADTPGVPQPEMPGFAHGTGGRFLNFGAGTPVMLHGRERVVTESEGRREGDAIAQMIRRLPEMMHIALRDAVRQGA